MKIRVIEKIKYGGQYYGRSEIVHVDQETGEDLVARGIAEKVRRSTRVRLQPDSLNMKPDDSQRTKK